MLIRQRHARQGRRGVIVLASAVIPGLAALGHYLEEHGSRRRQHLRPAERIVDPGDRAVVLEFGFELPGGRLTLEQSLPVETDPISADEVAHRDELSLTVLNPCLGTTVDHRQARELPALTGEAVSALAVV